MYCATEDYVSAKKMIERSIKQSFDANLVTHYEKLPILSEEQLLKQLKAWHQMYPRERCIIKALIATALINQQFDLA